MTNWKRDFYHVDKATIQVVELHLKVIFCLLTYPKFNFGEVEKAMIQVDAGNSEHIYFLANPKWDMGEVEKT